MSHDHSDPTAYLRALQLSQSASIDQVPPAMRGELEHAGVQKEHP